jgi:hypothetical protein
VKKNKGLLQKVALYCSAISFVLAVVCGVILFLNLGNIGFDHPVSASLLASFFFFVFVGVVLWVIGKSNLPSLKIRQKGDGEF